jgi:hypothetical protein
VTDIAATIARLAEKQFLLRHLEQAATNQTTTTDTTGR